MTDNNWGLFKIEQQDEGKPSKKPVNPSTMEVQDVKLAFTASLSDAQKALKKGYELGYLPREGSQWVGFDFDNAVEGGVFVEWADDLLGDTELAYATTPSGKGVRLIMPRGDRDAALGGAMERNNVGFFATEARGFTVPAALVSKLDENTPRDQALRDRVVERRGHIFIPSGTTVEQQHRAWTNHWLSKLSDNEQADAIAGIIANFPDVSDRYDWLNFMFACKNLQWYVDCDVCSMWDDRCMKSEGYVEGGNLYAWDRATYSKPGGITFMHLLREVEKAGYRSPHEPQRDLHNGPLGRLVQASPEFAERQEAEGRLQVLLDTYVYFPHQNVAMNLNAPNLPKIGMEGFRNMNKRYELTVGEGRGARRVNPVDAWLNHRSLKVSNSDPRMDPTESTGWTGSFLNTYQPFEPVEGVEGCSDTFVEFIEHVYPKDSEYALNWMAYKLQHPDERGVALVNYTPTGGTGRNSVHMIMRTLLGVNTMNLTADQLFGKDSNQFNKHLTNLLITVGEIDGTANDRPRVSSATYNKLKEIVDPNETSVAIEGKGVDKMNATTFCSYMFATNAHNGLPLDKSDRRFAVCRGNDKSLEEVRPDLIEWITSLDDDEFTRIYNFLKARDVSAFNFSSCPETSGRAAMIEAMKSPVDRVLERITEVFPLVNQTKLEKILMHLDETKRSPNVQGQVRAWMERNCTRPSWREGGRIKVKSTSFQFYEALSWGAAGNRETNQEDAKAFITWALEQGVQSNLRIPDTSLVAAE